MHSYYNSFDFGRELRVSEQLGEEQRKEVLLLPLLGWFDYLSIHLHPACVRFSFGFEHRPYIEEFFRVQRDKFQANSPNTGVHPLAPDQGADPARLVHSS